MRLYLGAMSVLFLAGALWLFVRRWLIAANGINVEGRVIAHEIRSSDDSTFYLPVVVFTDRQGAEHRFTAVAGGAEPRPSVGATVTVRYLPHHPNRAVIVSFLHMWAAPLAMLALGAGALVGYLKG
ncbi:MAG TPA: DUF3592 domain-containing protein [Burkholderiaceae bacterium]|nr:DUF3592 domain-containing protein [Burkholderiaceae bacterium]